MQDNPVLGWTVGVAAVGMVLGLLGAEIAELSGWADATTPAFVGKSFVHVASVIAAFVGGRAVGRKLP